VIENLGMKKLPVTAAEDLLEVFVRRYEKGSIIMTTNRPLEDWG
jgi:DNA replication protein DnaC